MRSHMKAMGFTLTELLIVIGIVCLLAALLFPVFMKVRRAGYRATSISNVRQCAMSLRMYMDDYDTDELPNLGAAREVLKNAPTCDPEDSWRKSCAEASRSPLIGSYAYVAAITPFDTEKGWKWYRSIGNQNPTLLVSIFQADERIRPFEGEKIKSEDCLPDFSDCRMPGKVVRARLDGSAETVPVHVYGSGKFLMSWNLLFVSDPANNPKGQVQP